MQLTPNFKLSEFVCGQTPTGMHLVNVKMLAGELQKLRNAVGRAITVVQGYCQTSEDTSFSNTHTAGIGACVRSSGISTAQLAQTAQQLMQSGQMVKGNIVVYNDRVHIDIRGTLNYIDHRTQAAPTPGGNTPAPTPQSQDTSQLPWYLDGATPYIILFATAIVAYELFKPKKQRPEE